MLYKRSLKKQNYLPVSYLKFIVELHKMSFASVTRSKQELSSFRIGRNQQINLDVRMEKVMREAGSSERSSILGSPGKQGTLG